MWYMHKQEKKQTTYSERQPFISFISVNIQLVLDIFHVNLKGQLSQPIRCIGSYMGVNLARGTCGHGSLAQKMLQ